MTYALWDAERGPIKLVIQFEGRGGAISILKIDNLKQQNRSRNA
jgi:hypothetical protein